MDHQPDLDWTALVADRKIKEAIDAGEFDDLEGKGKPLDLEPDPFTPLHLRVANRVLKNARALPEWLQIEKDIEREHAGVAPYRERMFRALRAARNRDARDRIAAQFRAEYRERVDLVNTMILKYGFVAPPAAQRPFPPFNLRAEMARLDADIAAALAAAPTPPRAS